MLTQGVPFASPYIWMGKWIDCNYLICYFLKNLHSLEIVGHYLVRVENVCMFVETGECKITEYLSLLQGGEMPVVGVICGSGLAHCKLCLVCAARIALARLLAVLLMLVICRVCYHRFC